MGELFIKLSVTISDGSFESSISVPLSATDKFDSFAAMWIDMMRKAVAIGQPPPQIAADTEGA